MRYWSIVILLLAATAASKGQDYLQGALDLERSVFGASGNVQKTRALLEKAAYCKQHEHFRDAIFNLARIDTPGLTQETRAQVLYERTLNYFLDHSTFAALSVYRDLQALQPVPTDEQNLLGLLILNESKKWDECRAQLLAAALARKDFADTSAIRGLITEPRQKDPLRARRLSAMLPGAGQAYAGYPGKGGASLLLNAGFLAFASYNFISSYYVMGIVSGTGTFLKFYKGGIELSEHLVEKDNKRARELWQSRYSELIFKVFAVPAS